MSTEGGNMTAGFALYYFLKSLPLPLTTWNVGSVESVGVPIFLAGQKRYACPGTRFLIHPLHWGFGNLVAADHARISEWRDCLDFDAERYAAIYDEATRGAPDALDIRSCLTGSARLYTAEQAVEAGIVHAAKQARLPEAGTTSHWWN
jgi:ATP-dependent protease ClpP protease subunit